MNKKKIIRAWRDEDYFNSLSEAEKTALPAHPSGLVDLRDEDLGSVAGGTESSLDACTVPQFHCTNAACTNFKC